MTYTGSSALAGTMERNWRTRVRGLWARPVLWAGLTLRLLLMPFFAHGDLLTVYWRSHLWVDLGRFEAVSFQIPVQYLHAAFLWGLKPVLPLPETIWPTELDGEPVDELSLTENWKQFISQPRFYRVLFFLKLPYLGFDVGCLIVLTFLARKEREVRRVAIFWWLNPIVLFGTYVFSRHDVIVQFFVLFSLLQFSRGKMIWALAWLGVAISLRFYPLLLLPFYLLSARLGLKQRVLLILFGLVPLLAVELYARLSLGYFTAGYVVALPHVDYILSARLSLGAWDNFYLFQLV